MDNIGTFDDLDIVAQGHFFYHSDGTSTKLSQAKYEPNWMKTHPDIDV
jgi:hypothetical protein